MGKSTINGNFQLQTVSSPEGTAFAALFLSKFQPLSLPLSPHATQTSYHLALPAQLSRPGVGHKGSASQCAGQIQMPKFPGNSQEIPRKFPGNSQEIPRKFMEITILPGCVSPCFSCSSGHGTMHPPMNNLAEIDRAALPRAMKQRPWAQDDTIQLRPQMFDD